MHLSHPGCVHYPRSCCAKELALNIHCALCPQCHKDLAVLPFFLFIFSYCHQLRRERSLGHTNRINRHRLSQPAKNTQPRFLWERCPLPHRAQPKILPSTFQRPAGQLLVLGFSRSHNERLSARQMSWCCLPLRRRWEPGSTFTHAILHNSGVPENSWKCKALVSQTPPFCSTLSW